jgi:glutaredoxin
MRILKRFIAFVFFSLFVIGIGTSQASTLNGYFFWKEGCPHCEKEEKFFESIKDKYPDFVVKDYEVSKHKENIDLLKEVGERMNVNVTGVPFLVVGDKYFVGFEELSSPKEIEERIKECTDKECPDSIAGIVDPGMSSDKEGEGSAGSGNEKKIVVPFLGEVNISSLSLPVLSILIGILDGFNPCAMWTLLFLISLLLGMTDRKRMWILGTAFIVSSAAVYFTFMVGWLSVIDYMGAAPMLNFLIGGLALFGGWYSLKEFRENKKGGCKVEKSEKQKAVFDSLKKITKKENFFVALLGIIALAFVVNLVELMCSAGFPAMFTQILVLNELSNWEYFTYIGIYIFFFMLDDMIVFITAMVTLEMSGMTTKFDRASKLIGGILMIIIGLLLFFKPEWLMIG